MFMATSGLSLIVLLIDVDVECSDRIISLFLAKRCCRPFERGCGKGDFGVMEQSMLSFCCDRWRQGDRTLVRRSMVVAFACVVRDFSFSGLRLVSCTEVLPAVQATLRQGRFLREGIGYYLIHNSECCKQ